MTAARVDLHAFGFSPGHYLSRCIDCPPERDLVNLRYGNQFEGAKGAYRCETHATAAMARHKDEQKQAIELARPGLAIAVGEHGLRITGIVEIDYGNGLRIEALTKDNSRVEYKAERVRG